MWFLANGYLHEKLLILNCLKQSALRKTGVNTATEDVIVNDAVQWTLSTMKPMNVLC